ncbi:MAG: TolC family protein [Acidobacteriota bacterium]
MDPVCNPDRHRGRRTRQKNGWRGLALTACGCIAAAVLGSVALADETLNQIPGGNLEGGEMTSDFAGVAQEIDLGAERLQGDVYRLTLGESIERALRNNLDIAVSRLGPQFSAAQVMLEEARFDSSFRFVAFTDEQQSPIASSLNAAEGARVLSTGTDSLEVSFTDPLLTGGSYSFRLRSLRTDTNSAFAQVNPSYTGDWQISFTQPLLKNFGLDANRTRLTVARNNQKISRSDFRQTVMDIVAAVENAYWDLSYRIMDLEVKKQSLELAEDLLRLNRTKVQVGTLAPIEITQAEAGVADREEGVIVAQNEIHNAEDQLKQFLGPPSDAIWAFALEPVDEPPFGESMPVLESSLDLALASRPDMERGRLEQRSREAELNQTRNQRLMDLTLDASYGATGLAGDTDALVVCRDSSGNITRIIDGFSFTVVDCANQGGTVDVVAAQSTDLSEALEEARDRDADSWRLGLTLTVPLGNRDARSRYISARLALEQARIDLRRVEQLVTLEVRRAVRQIETTIKRVKAARVNSRLQQEKLEAEQKKFENGISTSFNVLEFQEDLAQARSRRILALVDYNRARVEFERVLGTLPQARGIDLLP